MYHLVVLVFIFLGSVLYQASFVRSRRRLRTQSWQDIVGRLKPLDEAVLDSLSLACSSSSAKRAKGDASLVWAGLGGLRGVFAIRGNARTMLELAVYAERWNPSYGAVFAELVRADVYRLRRLTIRLCLLRVFTFGGAHFKRTLVLLLRDYAGLKSRLIAIYQECHAGRLSLMLDQL